ncbi:DUF2381 family protein [Corallococcus praedator]|uniref:DUF2381 family protein n=1 Tax=Corallococcus praedator TaxID=2316724 RepID=A0ABX9QC60_9BACT|nr:MULTISPECIES: DUF2381 family protein [Corallococcus]RKH14221.1 DUF2381 family protein [Corallococcus sp. CA047B]RKH23741.1 DUF2381 family protein [Corallococcus sp. CA031C]RKH99220.1 DUF2381 family protein [Corallococcus praedator]
MRKCLDSLLLGLLLTATVATAQERQPLVRNVYLSDDPQQEVPRIHVGSRIATVLRFEQDVDPRRTALLGWEGRFEPVLSGGKSVLLVPRQSLPPEDGFLLQVTLQDGTEIPFTLTAPEDGQADQQVNVFRDSESPGAVRSRLSDSRVRERQLREENERFRQEETSVDHALAALLTQSAVKMTPFRVLRAWTFSCDIGTVEIRGYIHPTKTAVVFQITNQTAKTSWRMKEARFSVASTGKAWPFALRMNQTEIVPGSSGTIAVVADLSTFDFKKGSEKLVLELFRHDGLREAMVVVEETGPHK